MRKNIIVGMTVALVLVIGSVNGSWAEPEDGHMMMEGHHHMGMGGEPMGIFNKLDLTKQQMDQADKILEEHRNDVKALHQKIGEARKALREAIIADTFNEQKIRAASKILASNMEEMAVLRGKIVSEIRTILTPEQIEQLKKMRAEHQEKKEKMKFMEKFRGMMLNESSGDQFPNLIPG